MKQQGMDFFLGVRPGEIGLTRRGREIQMLYRVDGQLKLLQAGVKGANSVGQILGMDCTVGAPMGDVDYLCRQVMGQVKQRQYAGVCCFFSGSGQGVLAQVVEVLSRRCEEEGVLFMVTESYGDIGEYSRVLVSTALSGGDLEGRFRGMIEKYGKNRVMMDIDCMGEDFLLPSPRGSGERRSIGEILRLQKEKRAQAFFSKELCARYFTYENGEHSLRFVLYDDAGTVEEKMKLGKLWKLAGIVGTFGELRHWNLV